MHVIARRTLLTTLVGLGFLDWAEHNVARAQTDALPSWNDTAPKKSIVGFVERVTKQGSADFVPPAQRIATFDNDGTLWAEQPLLPRQTDQS